MSNDKTKEKRGMKHYKIQVVSTVGGYVYINAKSEEDALEQVEHQVGEHGFDPLVDKLYRNHTKKYRDYTGAKITHREDDVFVESVDEVFERELVIGDKKYNSKTGKWTIGRAGA